MRYNQNLPHELGFKNPVVDIALTSDSGPESLVPSAEEGWEAVPGSLNSGVAGAPVINIHQQRQVQERVDLRLTWRPCACDVGKRTICAYPTLPAARSLGAPVRGRTQCTEVHVLPALPPDFVEPSPPPDTEFVFYIAQEQKINFTALASSPQQEFEWIFESLPPGMDVSPEERGLCEGGGGGAHGNTGCWERRRTLTWSSAWNQGGLRVDACVILKVRLSSSPPPALSPACPLALPLSPAPNLLRGQGLRIHELGGQTLIGQPSEPALRAS